MRITLIDLCKLLARRYVLVGACTAIGGALGVAAAYLIPPSYEAQVVLIPARAASPNWAASLSRLLKTRVDDSLLATAGRSFQPTSDKSVAVAALLSRVVTESYIREQNLLPVLFPRGSGPHWDLGGHSGRPATVADAADLFTRRIRQVNQDRLTGLVTVTIEWGEPRRAAEWANGIVARANEYLRQRALVAADYNVQYLTQRIEQEHSPSLNEALAAALGRQLGNRTVLAGTQEYAFHVLDPAAVPTERAFPPRVQVAILGVLLGIGAALQFVLFGLGTSGVRT